MPLQSYHPGTYVVGLIMSMRRSDIKVLTLAAACGLASLGGCYDDFRTWRMQQNDQIVTHVQPMNENCYRTLAGIDCYDKPDTREFVRRVQ